MHKAHVPFYVEMVAVRGPDFATGLLKRAWFIDTWGTSTGARWEYERMQKLGLDVRVLPKGWLDDYALLRNLI